MKRIPTENESEMKVALVELGRDALNVSTSCVGVFDVRTCLIVDLLSDWNLSSSRDVEKAWAVWKDTQHSLVTLSPKDAASVFAATSPLEGQRFVLSRAIAKVNEDRGRDMVIEVR